MAMLLFGCRSSDEDTVLYSNDAYTLYADKVVQGTNEAEALSSTHLLSNYISPASESYSRLVAFKLSINEKDNELPVGSNHWLVIGNDSVSPVIPFGAMPKAIPDSSFGYLPANYSYTFRFDVSTVLRQLDSLGYYEAYDGSRIAKADFKGIYLAGGSLPLSWDFVNLDNKGLKLEATDEPGIYAITVTLNPYEAPATRKREWKPTLDVSNKPQYQSEQPIVDALFNLSLEEALKNIEPDSTFRTGAKWGGVWTRDISYSILLAFAYHQPDIAKISLRKKVNRGRIVQDTGSGGAWPVSSDRTTWVLAAWEIFKVTGDKAWLQEVYPIVKNTLEDDYKTVFDPSTGLFSGESSFLDWREQTYPKWMNNMDIYVSQNLGTNAVHYQAHRILAQMAQLIGEPFDLYQNRATAIKEGMNKFLWSSEKGYYHQYLYGRQHLVASPRFEALGEALSILFDVAGADKAQSIMQSSPLTPFGATCIYPQIPGIPPYHNNGIWPFVQAYWNLAAAKAGNEKALTHGLGAMYRAAALFLTNYENFVAESGDFLGTEINSDRMLWSMAGNLAMVHRVFMGMSFETNGLYFNPAIPRSFGGNRSLKNFRYRAAILQINISGYGKNISKITMDGQPLQNGFVPAEITGNHTIDITMDNSGFTPSDINLTDNHFSLATPQLLIDSLGNLNWPKVSGAKEYRVYQNGTLFKTTSANALAKFDASPAEYSVSAIDNKGFESFISEPLNFSTKTIVVEAETFAAPVKKTSTNYSGKGYIETTTTANRTITFKITLPADGEYFVDLRYANGSGPWNTENKCAIRSLFVNDNYAGVLVMPQRGTDEWSDWGYSNAKKLQLKKGANRLVVQFEAWNNNMNVLVNTALIDHMRLQQYISSTNKE